MLVSPALKKSAALLVCGIIVASSAFITGCATTTYGQSFVRDEQVANQFRLKVYLSVLTKADAADKQANEEIDKYATSQKLGKGTVVNRRYNVFPEYYEYTVKFAAR